MDKEPTLEETFEIFRQTSKQVLYDIEDCLNRPESELVSEQEKDPFSTQLVPKPIPTQLMSIQEHINFHKMNKVQTLRPEEQIVDYNNMSTHSIEMAFESPLFHFNQFEEHEYEKQVEEVVHVHEACNLDDDPLCLDELYIDDLDTHTPPVEQVESSCEDAYLDDEPLFLDELFKNECDHPGEKTCVENLESRVSFEKRKLDLSIFTFDEPTNDQVFKNMI